MLPPVFIQWGGLHGEARSIRLGRISRISLIIGMIYFSSFSRQNLVSDRINKEFGSIAEFLYEISEACSKVKTGFLLIYDFRGRLEIYCGDDYQKVLAEKKVILALDLFEHAYFYDYGFERKKYVMNAISHFDFNKLQNV